MPGPVITHDRPDPHFYIQIIQHDDGNWEAQPMPLDDQVVNTGHVSITVPGLRTMTTRSVDTYALAYITRFAPDYAQRNALYILQTQTSGTDWTWANDMWNWITSVRTYSDSLNTSVGSMTFEQLVVFVIDGQNWPAVPPSIM